MGECRLSGACAEEPRPKSLTTRSSPDQRRRLHPSTGCGLLVRKPHYDDDARFLTEDRVYRGKQEIRGFFRDFLASLPVGAIDHFALRALRVHRTVAYITWCVGSDISLGTDTFVVEYGKIVAQTFAMTPVTTRQSSGTAAP